MPKKSRPEHKEFRDWPPGLAPGTHVGRTNLPDYNVPAGVQLTENLVEEIIEAAHRETPEEPPEETPE